MKIVGIILLILAGLMLAVGMTNLFTGGPNLPRDAAAQGEYAFRWLAIPAVLVYAGLKLLDKSKR